jgi:2-dehydro-3-deoxygalactonokinase
MTGELFDVLSRHSVLRHSLPAPIDTAADLAAHSTAVHWEEPGRDIEPDFLAGVTWGAERPLASTLFQVRAGALLNGRSPQASQAFLSGVLIGGELASLRTAEFSALPVLLCASGELAVRYQAALAALQLTQRWVVMPAVHTAQLVVRGQAVILRNLRTQLTNSKLGSTSP